MVLYMHQVLTSSLRIRAANAQDKDKGKDGGFHHTCCTREGDREVIRTRTRGNMGIGHRRGGLLADVR